MKFGLVEVSGEALSSDLRERIARRQSRDIPNVAIYESAIVYTPNPIGRFQFDIGVGTEQAIRLEAGLRDAGAVTMPDPICSVRTLGCGARRVGGRACTDATRTTTC